MTTLIDLAEIVEDLSEVLSATKENWAVEDLNDVSKSLREMATSDYLSVRKVVGKSGAISVCECFC